MSTTNSLFRARVAEGAVLAYRIVKPGVGPNSCLTATLATDPLLGTSDELDHVTGEMVDVACDQVPKVRLGGVVPAGAWLTSDATGRAVATNTVGQQIIGRAEIAGVADDVITYLRAPGQL
jgi:hypothetical protein